MKPTVRWMLGHPARIIAFGLGSGLIRPAPGTWGTLLGWATFAPLTSALSLSGVNVLLLPAAAFLLGIWACDAASRHLGVADPGGIVWDEVAAFWLVLTFAPTSFSSQLAGFLLFRAFDIIKPAPIRHFDARWKGGFGVMFDDLLAAGYTLLVMALWARLSAGW